MTLRTTRRAALAAALAAGAAALGASPAGAQTAPSPAPTLPPPGPVPLPNPAPPRPGATPPGGAPITSGGAPVSSNPATLAGAPPGPLTLGGAARLAAQQSAGSEAARFRTRQAAARVVQSRAALLPTVSALASQNARTFNTASFGISFPAAPGQRPLFDPNGQVAGPVNIYDLRGRVAADLFDVAALGRLRAARQLVRAGEADADNQAQLAAASAASAYLRVERAEAQLANRAADSTLAAELAGIAEQQLRAGTGVALDVTRARAQFAATRAQLIAARGERDRARLDLARALGVPLDAPVVLADTLAAPAPTATDEAGAVATALRRRADLRTAAEQLAAARQQARAIRDERLPSVQAFADNGNTGLALDRRLLNTYTYGVQVNVPIFDAFRRQGREQEQAAAVSELDVRRRDLETQAAVDVRGALLDLRSAAEQAAAARERLSLSEQEVAQARDRFRAGVAGNADVITASQSLTGARTAYVDALATYQNARVALARAQGAVTDLP